MGAFVASAYGCDATLATGTVGLSTLLVAVSLPFVMDGLARLGV